MQVTSVEIEPPESYAYSVQDVDAGSVDTHASSQAVSGDGEEEGWEVEYLHTNADKHLNKVVEPLTPPTAGRLVAAFIVGIVSGPLLYIPIGLAMGMSFASSDSEETWGVFFWGTHWFWRGATSFFIVVVSSLLAAITARRYGNVVAALAALPGALLWGIVSYLCISGQAESIGWQSSMIFGHSYAAYNSKINVLVAVILAFGSIPLAYLSGSVLTPIDEGIARHFDSRKWSAFGIRWYHFFWVPVVLFPMIVATVVNLVYASDWFRIMWSPAAQSFDLTYLIPGFFGLATYGTLYLQVVGPYRAYLALADFNDGTAKERTLQVVGYGIGFPLLSVVLQIVIRLLHAGLVWLIS